MWEFATITQPTARKQHTCDNCLMVIESGQQYFRCDGKIEGEMASYKSHADCEAASQRIMEVAGLGPDEWVSMHDLDPDDYPLLRKEFPALAERLGLFHPDVMEDA